MGHVFWISLWETVEVGVACGVVLSVPMMLWLRSMWKRERALDEFVKRHYRL